MNSNYLFASHDYSRSRTLSALVFRTSQSLNAKEMLGKQFQYVQMESQNKSANFLQRGNFKHSAGKKKKKKHFTYYRYRKLFVSKRRKFFFIKK